MDEDSGKLVGPNIEEDDVFYLWYYLWFPVIIFIQMAQSIFSIVQLLFGLLSNDESAWCSAYCIAWTFCDISYFFVSNCWTYFDG